MRPIDEVFVRPSACGIRRKYRQAQPNAKRRGGLRKPRHIDAANRLSRHG
jgi:hypothetical protein